MSLQPAPFSGDTSGASARANDTSAMSQQEIVAVASEGKVSGGRRRKSGRKSGRKSSRKSSRKSGRKTGRKTARRTRSWFTM